MYCCLLLPDFQPNSFKDISHFALSLVFFLDIKLLPNLRYRYSFYLHLMKFRGGFLLERQFLKKFGCSFILIAWVQSRSPYYFKFYFKVYFLQKITFGSPRPPYYCFQMPDCFSNKEFYNNLQWNHWKLWLLCPISQKYEMKHSFMLRNIIPTGNIVQKWFTATYCLPVR